jgi:hypothetical protein
VGFECVGGSNNVVTGRGRIGMEGKDGDSE